MKNCIEKKSSKKFDKKFNLIKMCKNMRHSSCSTIERWKKSCLETDIEENVNFTDPTVFFSSGILYYFFESRRGWLVSFR
jgi:hypothetical protein